MKLHSSVVEKLVQLVQNYGGHEHEHRLREKFKDLDLTPYERTQANQDIILVLTEDYMKQLANSGR